MSFVARFFTPTPQLTVPTALPHISAPTAADLCKAAPPQDAAAALLSPEQTPPQYLAVLGEHQMGDDMVKVLAHGMSDRDGVFWATRSAEKVADQLPPTEVNALKAAQAWVANPTPQAAAAAGDAAKLTDFRGPGAWAAQGAAWTAPPASPVPGTPPMAMPRLTPHAVVGAVMISVAIKAFPKAASPLSPPSVAAPPAAVAAAPTEFVPVEIPKKVATQTFRAQQPFIADGLDIASGKVSPG